MKRWPSLPAAAAVSAAAAAAVSADAAAVAASAAAVLLFCCYMPPPTKVIHVTPYEEQAASECTIEHTGPTNSHRSSTDHLQIIYRSFSLHDLDLRSRFIHDLYDLHNLYDLAHVAGWEPYNLHHLQ